MFNICIKNKNLPHHNDLEIIGYYNIFYEFTQPHHKTAARWAWEKNKYKDGKWASYNEELRSYV